MRGQSIDNESGGFEPFELHGGSIEARSNGSDERSEFISSPIFCDAVTEHNPVNPGSDTSTKSTGLRVLVVDDHRDSAECLSRVMRRAGNEMRLACDGVEAIRVAAVFQPDVVLLDIGMPRMNGYEAARHIRRHTWGGKATLIAVTAWGRDGDRQKSKEAGFDHHLVKPVAVETLLKILESFRSAALT